jgi:hypothetical protein
VKKSYTVILTRPIFSLFTNKVLALYARGLSTRELQAHLEELYGVEVSPTLIANVTAAVLDEVRAWQARPLASVYPIQPTFKGLWQRMENFSGTTA